MAAAECAKKTMDPYADTYVGCEVAGCDLTIVGPLEKDGEVVRGAIIGNRMMKALVRVGAGGNDFGPEGCTVSLGNTDERARRGR